MSCVFHVHLVDVEGEATSFDIFESFRPTARAESTKSPFGYQIAAMADIVFPAWLYQRRYILFK